MFDEPMRPGPLLATVVVLFTSSTSLPEPGSAELLPPPRRFLYFLREANSFAQKTFEDAHVTGAQLAILDHGQLVWNSAFGFRHRDPDLSMHRDTSTWAASVTKSVFATYVMIMVERGEFKLDDPLAVQLGNPLDECESYKDSASEIVKDPLWQTVTPRMLLAHSSGLGNFAFLEPDKKLHLHFMPGTQFLYSGEGINLLQLLIEQRTQKPPSELMQDAIFIPLSMSRTSMVYRQEFATDMADRFNLEGKFIAETRRSPARAAGSMTTSAADLARFACAFLDGKIIKDSPRAEMLKPYVRINAPHQFPLHPDEPEGKETAEVGLADGLGWGLLTHTHFGPAFFKEGHVAGAQNYIICFEKQKSCMILLTHSDNGEAAFRPLLEHIFGDTVTPWEWEGYTQSYRDESRKTS